MNGDGLMKSSSICVIGLAALLLAGCATTPQIESPTRISGADKWFSFPRLHAEATGEGIVVHGRIWHERRKIGYDRGHIHVEAWSDGTPIATRDMARPKIGWRAGRSARFATTLPIDAGRVGRSASFAPQEP